MSAAFTSDPFYRFIERTWRFQQLPLALILYAFGGWAWVLWGISVRIVLSLTGHWAVVHFSHKGGHQGWRIAGLPVQGYNLPRLGLITFGEAFHSNHHAFLHSARLGLEPGQPDPGFWLIRSLAALGLANNVQLPDSAPPRLGPTPQRPHPHPLKFNSNFRPFQLFINIPRGRTQWLPNH